MASMILVKSQAIKNNAGMNLFIFPTAHESWHLCSFIIICTIKIIPMDTFVTGLCRDLLYYCMLLTMRARGSFHCQ